MAVFVTAGAKSLMRKDVPAVQAGGQAQLSGPTTSKRDYPKGSLPGDTRSAPFNPQGVNTTGIYVEGV